MVAPPPSYRRVTAVPPDRQAQPVRAERATLRVATALDGARVLHVINVHLKSKLPTAIPMIPCEQTVPESARYSLFHHGRGLMLDHVLASRPLLAFYKHTEIHNELLHDESSAFATDVKFPESDHAPVIAEFSLP